MTTQEAWTSYQHSMAQLESAEDSWRDVARIYSEATRTVDECREAAMVALARYRRLQETIAQQAVA